MGTRIPSVRDATRPDSSPPWGIVWERGRGLSPLYSSIIGKIQHTTPFFPFSRSPRPNIPCGTQGTAAPTVVLEDAARFISCAAADLKPHEGEVFWGLKTGDFGGEKRPKRRGKQTRRNIETQGTNSEEQQKATLTLRLGLRRFRSRTKAGRFRDCPPSSPLCARGLRPCHWERNGGTPAIFCTVKNRIRAGCISARDIWPQKRGQRLVFP